ncbi:acyl-CoA dehydrogenase family protein [Hyphomonas sp.]|uniref:acyl-CoA dehydrogenase family protein n=1 Tax=Hyphomonas sp. TaxID=87 RepID=UPI0039E4ED7F
MNFDYSPKTKEYLERVGAFMDTHVFPAVPVYQAQHEADRWGVMQVLEDLKDKAKAEGLWNLFLPPNADHDTDEYRGAGLSNADYAPLSEMMGRVSFGSEVFNCSAPDTGNMEVLHRYGSDAQKEQWMKPLMNGDIRSAFLMTEPLVASSDATNIETSIVRDGDDYVINGRKWWSSGAGDPRCRVAIIMGKTDFDAPRHAQQSQVLVPMDAPGMKTIRMLPVFGYDDSPHGHAEMVMENVRVPVGNLILGEGRGFEIAQGRLGPGRIHHCMRTIGAAEVALEKMTRRLLTRQAFGKSLYEHSIWEQRLGEARIEIDMCRLLTLKAASMMDSVGNKGAANEIAMIKVAAPRMALKIIDDAIQAHGGGGVTSDFGLAESYAGIRSLRLADGPDEVHLRAIARNELKKYRDNPDYPTHDPKSGIHDFG